jgi:hypothetical protein
MRATAVHTHFTCGSWVVEVEGTTYAASFATRDEAVAAGQRIARFLGVEHVISEPSGDE